MMEGTPRGRPAFCCGVMAVLDCGLLPAWACLGERGAADMVDSFCTGLSGIGKSIILHEMIYVV